MQAGASASRCDCRPTRVEGSTVRIWVPYSEFVADVEALSPAIGVDVYTGDGVVPASIADVEFFVAPYATTAEALGVTARMPRLKVLQTLSAGYEHALPYRPAGVTLCNARGVHDASTAELAMALILASLRHIPEFVRARERHEWLGREYPALADKHVLIVGYGSIGAALDRRLVPFETTITKVARRPRPGEGVHGVADLPRLLPAADVVVLITPLTPRTRHLVDADFLARMKTGALLVNIARGGVVDTEALLAALRAGRITAALDVTDPEPLPSDHPLWGAPGLLISPHVGGDSSAFLPRARRLVREQIARYVRGEPLENVVVSPDTPAAVPSVKSTFGSHSSKEFQ
ncbi:MAG: 2-hydroxyacid dehydrogenase [Gaiellaceae bacterium]